MIGLAGVVLSLILLMYLAYRGINVLVLAPLLALLAVLAQGDLPLLGTYTQLFMGALGRYLIQFFPLFLLGAIFGKLMDDSGSARAIAHWIVGRVGAQRAILAVVLACGILTYGGVSLFVVAFAVFPIAASLFRESGTPKRLIPGAIALGSFTFTMTALPGTPAIQNAIPSPFFGTDAFAAPGLGSIAALVMFGVGMAWLNWRASAAQRAGEGYLAVAAPGGLRPGTAGAAQLGDVPREAPPPPGAEQPSGVPVSEGQAGPMPSMAVAFAPVVIVIAVNWLFLNYGVPLMDTAYLAEPKYGSTNIGAVRGIWSIIVALLVAIAFLLAATWRSIGDVKRSVNEGTMGSLLPIFNTASEVGYGATIASLPAFAIIKDAVLNVGGGNPVISLAVAVNVLAGITGSASGGMSIALQTLGPTYAELAQAAGINPQILHRVAALASGGFDSLPHNGAVITLLTITGLTHRDSYADIGMVSVVIPLLALVAVLVLFSLFGTF
ncbi:GntP family permease [Siccirubricoccus sp. G192]|uniref:GntP family permease n=1 Tax=Siccirubricoccus sp. G192 TaxID=2849651 RepID=UPI001C2B80C1|nr:GntP family permease [Siccirubricoccus sp. G192]MBV1796065.1 GntP family permease [Siccirubricoccus sp. G192]